jgi:hypothetical protein
MSLERFVAAQANGVYGGALAEPTYVDKVCLQRLFISCILPNPGLS